MATYVNTFFEDRVQNLFALAELVETSFSEAGLDYAVVGGLATYLYVEEREPDAGRLTRDIDIVVRRADLAAIAQAVEACGLEYRQVAGVDMLLQKGQPTRRAVHLVFSGEKVREQYPEATPEISEPRILRGVRLVAAEALIQMKLSSFRLKDRVHLKDLDEAGVITPEIVERLGKEHRARLDSVRAEV